MTGINLESFTSIRENNIMKLKEFKQNGGKVVGRYCTYTPNELILAAGAVPVGLCGTSEKPIPAAEEVLPRNLCPLIKSSYGFAATDTCPFFYFSDFILGETTCDGKKKMFELMQEIKPVHVMQLPYADYEHALDMWTEELRRLRKRIDDEFGVKISDDDIWKAIDLVNRETVALKALCDLNQSDPPYLSGIDILTIMWAKSFNCDHEELISMLQELKKQILASPAGSANSGGRILLTGCPVGTGTEKVIKLVEELGASVVAMENCSGYKTLELQTEQSFDDPIVALAHKYIKIPCSCMSPNPYRLELLQRMINDFKVDAVIDLTWQACHTYNIEAYSVSRLVKENEIPYLQLETDYSLSDMESLQIRIEAMLEMIG